MSSEEVVAEDVDTKATIDTEVMAEFCDLRDDCIEYCIKYYGKHLDKILDKLSESDDKSKTMTKTMANIKERHLKEYEKYVEKCLDKRLKTLFTDRSVVRQLVHICDNRDANDLSDVQKEIQPLKQTFIAQLKAIEDTIDGRYDEKSRQLSQLTDELTLAVTTYESNRKSLQKKVLAIVNELDSIDV